MSVKINDLLNYAIKAKASDLHLSTGSIPMVRIDGVMQTLQLPVMTKEFEPAKKEHLGKIFRRLKFEQLREQVLERQTCELR